MIRGSLPNLAQFKQGMEAQRTGWQNKVRRAVRDETEGLKARVRNEVDRAFSRGRRVSGAVRSKLYDNADKGTAGIVYSKFGRRSGGIFQDFIGARLYGANIIPVKGKWLAIPVHWGRARQASKRRAAAKLMNEGKLRFVPIRGGKTALLVRDYGKKSVPVFLLIRKARFPRRTTAEALLGKIDMPQAVINAPAN